MSLIVFLDTETGGLRPEHPIIQLAAVAVELTTGAVHETFEAKLRFDVAVCDPQALRINRYAEQQDQWETALPPNDAMARFKAFLERHESVNMKSARSGRAYRVARVGGHNIATFDVERISRAFKAAGLFLPVQFSGMLDTLHAAAWYFEGRPDHIPPKDFKLGTLCEHFEIPTAGAHEALADVLMTIALARKLLDLNDERKEPDYD